MLRQLELASLSFENQFVKDSQIYINNLSPKASLLSEKNVTQVSVGEGASCDNIEWQAKSNSFSLVLSPGDGFKKISYKYKLNNASSSCQTETVYVDTTPPVFTNTALTVSSATTTDSTRTPVLFWSPIIEAGSGLKNYEISVGTTSEATDIASWTSMGSNLSGEIVGLSLADGTYFINLRALDNSFNSSVIFSQTFTVQAALIPQLSLQVPASSPGNVSSPILLATNVQNGGLVKVYSDITCNNFLASATASGPQVAITVPALSMDGNYSFYSTNTANGSTSPCSAGLSYIYDSMVPVVAIGAPTPLRGNETTSFSWNVTYMNADVVTLTAGDITLAGSGSTGCSVSVTGSGVATRTVSVNGCTGNGPLHFSIAANSAKDTAGNVAVLVGPSADVTVDNVAPSLVVGAPSPASGKSTTSFVWTVTYAGADSISLGASDIILNGPGSTGCLKTVAGEGPSIRNVIVTNCSGNGSLDFTIAANTAADQAGNHTSSLISSSVTLDQTIYTIEFASSMDEVNEGNAPNGQSFQVNIFPVPAVPITVNFNLNSFYTTASNPTDFNLVSGSVPISPGQGSATIEYTYNGNGMTDPSKIIQLTLTDATGANIKIGNNQSVRRLVKDDEAAISYSKIAAGKNHTCGITTIGVLKCWGSNSNGQLGDGTTTDRFSPVVVDSGTSYDIVSVGDRYTCGITTGGALKCWGYNGLGQLGDNSYNQRVTPVVIDSGIIYSSVSIGFSHSCGITTTGILKCWGQNSLGQLGDGTTLTKTSPVLVDGGVNYNYISVGNYHTCGITTTGVLKCWGYNYYGQVGDGTSADSNVPVIIDPGVSYNVVDSGYLHTCGISVSGVLKCWGYNGWGQLGDNTFNNNAAPVVIDSGIQYVRISSASNHTCGITTSSALKCWGSNDQGQLGDGTTQYRSTPALIDSGSSFSDISGGDKHTCGVSAGMVKCWGDNIFGELGSGQANNSTLPTLVVADSLYGNVSAGSTHSCGITIGGALKCWGGNLYGQLGNGNTLEKKSPVSVDAGVTYIQVSGGYSHTCGIISSGIVKCWGYNGFGQLGDGTYNGRQNPIVVDNGTSYRQIATGSYHTCGITASGILKCWGYNFNGQLGDGTNTNRSLPVIIDSGTSYIAVTAGSYHTCGITASGILKCWGHNHYGQLGDGTVVDKTSPNIIDAGITYSKISAGGSHTCGLVNAGNIKCWGGNFGGQVGDGTIIQRESPVLIDGGNSYSSISVGGMHTCGILVSGGLKCWGYNYEGQIGDGTTIYRYSPVPIDALSNYSAISAGASHTCGVTSLGSMKCWGQNGNGRLGDGRFYIPLPIIP